MALPADIVKASAAQVKALLGSDCTHNGTTALGKCSLHLLNPAQVRETLGEDYENEQDLEWAMIATDPSFTIKVNDSIAVDDSTRTYIVRRVARPLVGGIAIENRCLCVVKVG